MNALEIIHLRMAGTGTQSLVDLVRDSVGSQADLSDVRIYRHSKLETDLVVHLHRTIDDRSNSACECGERLASVLRAYGLVEHSVWLEHASADER